MCEMLDRRHDLSGVRVAVRLGRVDRGARRHGNRLTDGDDVPLAPAPLPPLGAGSLDILGADDRDRNDRRSGGEGHVGRATLRLASARLADDLALDVDGDSTAGIENLDSLRGRFERPFRATVYRNGSEPFQDATHDRVLEQLGHRHEGDVRTELDDRREQADGVVFRTVV